MTPEALVTSRGDGSRGAVVPGQRRDPSLDIARGMIVALMALDHVRIFFANAQFDPVDLDSTNAGWFLTRWVTHLCAPGFFFIAGFGAGLLQQSSGRAATARFLLTRGAFLAAAEILIFGLAWSFNPGWWWFGVIWCLGLSMLVLALLIYLPRLLLFGAAAVFTLLHNSLWPLLPPMPAALDAILYSAGIAGFPLAGERLVLYPLLPWLALMVLGYAAAPWLDTAADPRGRRSLAVGAAAVAAYVIVRMMGFGEPASGGFDAAGGGERAMLSFLNVEKYPPSLQFSLVTVGLVLAILGLLRRVPGGATPMLLRPLLTFGRVPFFFYLIHLFLIHGAAFAAARLMGWRSDYLFWSGVGPNLIPPDGFGVSLAGVYAVWIAVLAVLLPLCAWFAALKRRNPSFLLKLL